MEDIDVKDVEEEEDSLVVYAAANELFNIKKAIEADKPETEFTIDEQTMLPTNYVEITDEDTDKKFQKMLDMLEDCEDVQKVYHNVKG